MEGRGAAEDGEWAAQVEQLESLEDDEGNLPSQFVPSVRRAYRRTLDRSQ